MKLRALLAGLATTAIIAINPALAQEKTLRMATAAPEGTIWQQHFDRFAADVAEETEGRVKIDVFYNSQLGNEQTVISQVVRGRIDMSANGVGPMADQLTDAYLISLLFFYDDLAVRSCVLDAMKDDYRDMILPTGIRFLDWAEVGTAQLAAKEQVTSPEQIRGKRMGVTATKISNLYWEMQGAIPVNTPVTDVAANLSTGLIDIYPSIPIFYVFAGINKLAPVWNEINYLLSPGAIVISDRVWQELAEEDRAGIERALARHPAADRSAEFFAVEKAVVGMHLEAGGTVHTSTEAEQAAWRAIVPEYYEQVMELVSPEGRIFFGKMQDAKATCEAS